MLHGKQTPTKSSANKDRRNKDNDGKEENNQTGETDSSSTDTEKEQLQNRKGKEQKDERSCTTGTKQKLYVMEKFTLLKIMHVVVSKGKIKRTVNVLFDDASTKIYINSGVAE